MPSVAKNVCTLSLRRVALHIDFANTTPIMLDMHPFVTILEGYAFGDGNS